MNCVSTATMPKMISSTSVSFSPPTLDWIQPAMSFEAPLFSMASPSGMAPAMKT